MTTFLPHSKIKRLWQQQSGATLIIVLSSLVLLSVLVIGFFLSVKRDVTASRQYAQSVAVEQLAKSATDIVKSQIELATSGGVTRTWTSQPGLLRTFNSNGQAVDVFKLYSAPEMAVSASDYSETDDSPPSDWNSGDFWSGLYADINQPLPGSGGQIVYPVVDPSAAGAGGTPGVDGFEIGIDVPGYVSSQPASAVNNPVPMPARWLYVLEDGALAVPESVNAQGVVTFAATGAIPSAGNRIVGRIAFWTDDDTSKLNINTAGIGLNTTQGAPEDGNSYWTYWDTPLLMSRQEHYFLSRNQPWHREYQRYPGHPATTSLAGVLRAMDRDQILALSPRLSPGGSDGGNNPAPPSNSTQTIPIAMDRLFASVDELKFQPDRTLSPGVSMDELSRKARFFLTANNRAPELNLFNQPRVAIWPIPSQEANRSPEDRLIAFASTVNGVPYYFTREDPASPTTDINLARNQDAYAYLQRMTGRKIPGFGGPSGGFADTSKYGPDRNQILTNIFDTIRIANLRQTSASWQYTGRGTAGGPDWKQVGQVVPTQHPNGTRGGGRFKVISEVTSVFTSMGSTASNSPPTASDESIIRMGLLLKFVQTVAGSVAGGSDWRFVISGLETFQVRDRNGNPMTVFSGDTYEHFSNRFVSGAGHLGGPDSEETNWLSGSQSSATYKMPPTSEDFLIVGSQMEFLGGRIRIQMFGRNNVLTQELDLQFPPATFSTPIYRPNDRPWSTEATVTKTYEPSEAPFPTAPVAGSFAAPGRFRGTVNTNHWISHSGPTSVSTDRTRSIVFASGDHRILASKQSFSTDPGGGFQPFHGYDTNSPHAHSLRASSTGSYGGATFGFLIPNFSGFISIKREDVPAGINGARNVVGGTGDWSNGPGWMRDGAFLPKPEEGAAHFGSDGAVTSRGYFIMNTTEAPSTVFSPNRQIASPVLFGGLPTGVLRDHPWQTLLFRPAKAFHPGGTNHPGAVSPPDHLLLDLFWMPIVEPYAISEPFSSAGKVNLNHRIKPFGGYIDRSTALRGVLASVRIPGFPDDTAGYRADITGDYDPSVTTGNNRVYQGNVRWPINLDATVAEIDKRFNNPDRPVYVSASEICDIDLIPEGQTASNLASFWSDKRVTGDNAREQPYNALYPRLTTRSNTFTVHIVAESLVQSGPDYSVWTERLGQVSADWRGAVTIERYIDPNDDTIPDFLVSDESLDDFYQFRTLATRRFIP